LNTGVSDEKRAPFRQGTGGRGVFCLQGVPIAAPYRLDWKKPGKYPKLGGLSLEDWLRANHQGRSPSEILPELEAIVGHDVPISSLYNKCKGQLGLYASREARGRAARASSRVTPRQPIPQFDPEAVWEATKALAEELRFKVEQVNRITVDLSDQTLPVGIAELADMHVGGIGVDYDAIERDTAIIAETDGLYCTLGGDGLDDFILPFMLGGMDSQVITASTQWRLLAHRLDVIKDKTLYARAGNHEGWVRKRAQIDKFDELVSSFGILNVKDIGVADIFVGRQKYVLEAAHKFWGRSRMNPFWTCMRLLDFGIEPDPDILLVEHEHVPAAGWFWRRGKQRYALRTGTYKVKDPYAAEHHFYGAAVGPAVIIYWPDHHRLHLSHSVAEAAQYLGYLREGHGK